MRLSPRLFSQINFSSLKTILFFALVFRLFSAVFSEGYGMHDDHFVIIETAASWSDGIDNSGWLSWSEQSIGRPQGHSFTYVGLNYLLFKGCKSMGIYDPKTLMLINRLLHAVFSLLVVYFGFKITEKISTTKNAVIVAWLLALTWAFPFLSVRNLVEMTALPFLLWGMWWIIKEEKNQNFLCAGLLIGVAISFRYQIAIFAITVGAIYFFRGQFKHFFLFCIGLMVTFSVTQGIVDFCVWGYPFAEFIGYATYNANEGTEYMSGNQGKYLMYFLVLMGIMLFPFGLLMGTGFFRSWKKHFLLFLPTLVFILFHTFYPNKQERFVLSVLPFFILLGVIGMACIREKPFWGKMWKISWVSFWVLNIPLLLFFTFSSSKKSLVDSMYAWNDNTMSQEQILLEATADTKPPILMPQFYASSWDCKIVERADSSIPMNVADHYQFDYVLFFGEKDLGSRIAAYKKIYPKLQLVRKCEPSPIDKVLHRMNPKHIFSQYIEVWETDIRNKK
jgi:hypothetical protein